MPDFGIPEAVRPITSASPLAPNVVPVSGECVFIARPGWRYETGNTIPIGDVAVTYPAPGELHLEIVYADLIVTKFPVGGQRSNYAGALEGVA
tara:strand:- start:3295 stop:3573 length:279 start_codon:yes stop_codon:yes gene_type:complete